MIVKAGKPIDDFIDQVLPFLDPGDILIDGGNSHFEDTIKQTKKVKIHLLIYPPGKMCGMQPLCRTCQFRSSTKTHGDFHQHPEVLEVLKWRLYPLIHE